MLNVARFAENWPCIRNRKNRHTCRVAMVRGHGQDMKVSVRGVRV